jgi:hypothetical protein
VKHRALVIGAGRIGAGYNWHDDAYTHAGAYRALADRVELVGFVEPDDARGNAAVEKWAPTQIFSPLKFALDNERVDVVSICTQPQDQYDAIVQCIKAGVKYIWCEKPYEGPRNWPGVSIQVNYMRRGDKKHRGLVGDFAGGDLIVYGKDDIHTRCHFEDLAKWWHLRLDFRPFNGPCAYVVSSGDDVYWFDNGGFNSVRTPGDAFKAMLGNLLDHVDNGTPLWSPAT